MAKSKRNIWAWVGITVLALALVVVLLGQLILPSIAEDRINTAIREYFSTADEVEIEAKSSPAIKMAFGRFDSIEVKVKGIVLEDIPVEVLTLKAEDIIVTQKAFEMDNPFKNADISFMMTVEQVEEKFLSKISSLDNLDIRFEDNQVSLIGVMSIFGINIEVEAVGELVVMPSNMISYNITEINVDNSNLGSAVVNMAKELINFQFSLGELPWGIILSDIDVSEEYVTFYGYMRN